MTEQYGGYASSGYGDLDHAPNPASTLTWRVANSLTGKLIGTLHPSAWSYDDPLSGVAKGELTLALPGDASAVTRLVNLTRPHVCQVGALDGLGRWWFGGPVVAEPAMNDRQVKVSFADWRAWFYATSLDADIIKVGEEQMLTMSDLAEARVSAAGAPHLTVDNAAVSGVLRDSTFRRTTRVGAALDDVALRAQGPDWWTYLETDPADSTTVVAHLAIAYPERTKGYGLYLRHRLGSGGNLSNFTWPEGNTPATRVIGTHGTPPDQLVVVAEDPEVAAGNALVWDELYPLPDGVDATSAFDYTLARLVSRQGGTVTADVDPAATDLGAWGPGERARLSVDDGWRAIEEPSVRVINRTLAGRGPHVTSVKVAVALSDPQPDIEPPTPEVI